MEFSTGDHPVTRYFLAWPVARAVFTDFHGLIFSEASDEDNF